MWTVIERCVDDSNFGIFQCDCGTIKRVSWWSVKYGASKTCGCVFQNPHFFIDGIEYKNCSKCKKDTPVSNFRKNVTRSDKLNCECGDCTRESCRKRGKERRKTDQAWVKSLREYQKEKEYDKKYYEGKRQRRLKRMESDPEYAKNLRKKRADYAKKYREDPIVRIKANLRGYPTKLLGNKKTSDHRALVLLGCSVEEFMLHLEGKFQEGMTWDNYGVQKGIKTWEIDHIMPLSLCDVTDEESIKRCCHFTNLQPLWVNHNRSKSNKLDWVLTEPKTPDKLESEDNEISF